jgi:hypothetical protein
VPGINDVRQTETHTSEPAVPNGSALDVTTTFENVAKNKSLGDLEFREKLSTRKMKHYFPGILKSSVLFGMKIGCSP